MVKIESIQHSLSLWCLSWNRRMSSHSLALTSAPQNRTPGNPYVSPYDDDYSQNQPHYGVPAPLHYRQEEGGGMFSPWRLFEERVRTGPYGLTSFPSQPYSPIRILILTSSTQDRVNPRLRQFISDSPPRIRNDWQLGFAQHEREVPGLTNSELKKAMMKLRKEVYNPTYPKKKSWTEGLFGTKSKVDIDITDNKAEGEKNEGKSCIICLEAFVPNEHVLVTPCNHMFHNDCLVPWVKSHGKCPVCRSVIYERRGRALSRNNNYNNDVLVSEDDSAIDLNSLIRAMEEALSWVNNSH